MQGIIRCHSGSGDVANKTRTRLARWTARVGACGIIALTVALGGAPAASADSIRDEQWEHAFLQIAKAHQITKGEGVTVAVVDTGVDGHHPDLIGTVMPEGYDASDMAFGNGWQDEEGHGTGIASIIAGHGHGPSRGDGVLGIAPGVKILTCKAGDSDDGNVDYAADAIEKAVERGANVINVSLGYRAQGSEKLQQAVKSAIDNDVVVVAAVGNTSKLYSRVAAPANYSGVVAVSAIGRDGKISSDSVTGREVVLAAPGVDIMVADLKKGYAVGTGTSASAAIVSGVAALFRAKYPDLNAASVIQRLITTADDKGTKGRDPEYGYGIVNPLKALTADVKPIKHNPLMPEPFTPKPTSPSDSGGDYLTIGLASAAVLIMIVLSGWLAILAIRHR